MRCMQKVRQLVSKKQDSLYNRPLQCPEHQFFPVTGCKQATTWGETWSTKASELIELHIPLWQMLQICRQTVLIDPNGLQKLHLKAYVSLLDILTRMTRQSQECKCARGNHSCVVKAHPPVKELGKPCTTNHSQKRQAS